MDIICNPIIRHAMIQTNATMIMVDVNIYVIILQEVMCVHVQVVTTLLLINITALIKMNAMTIMVIVHRTAITLQGAIIVVATVDIFSMKVMEKHALIKMNV
jgi:hypothetical protein